MLIDTERAARIIAELREPSSTVPRIDLERLLQVCGFGRLEEDPPLVRWTHPAWNYSVNLNLNYDDVPRAVVDRVLPAIEAYMRLEEPTP